MFDSVLATSAKHLAVRNLESPLFGDGGVSKLNRLLKSPPFGALGPDLLLARLLTDTILFPPPFLLPFDSSPCPPTLQSSAKRVSNLPSPQHSFID